MKIVEATWEKRNIGLKVYEVEVELDDSVRQIMTISDISDADYISVKVPAGMMSAMNGLSELGFKFIECLQTVSVARLPTLTNIQARLEKQLGSRPVTNSDIDQIFAFIRAGLFSSDRFALDQRFTKIQSAKRYEGWIHDARADGGLLRSIVFKSHVVGFYLVQPKGNGVFQSMLAGTFPNLAPVGIGSMINHMAYDFCFANGARQVRTTFSTNNKDAVKIHLGIPLTMHKLQYVYVKHFAVS